MPILTYLFFSDIQYDLVNLTKKISQTYKYDYIYANYTHDVNECS